MAYMSDHYMENYWQGANSRSVQKSCLKKQRKC